MVKILEQPENHKICDEEQFASRARLLAYVTGRVKASRGGDVGDGTDEQALRFINEIRKARTTELGSFPNYLRAGDRFAKRPLCGRGRIDRPEHQWRSKLDELFGTSGTARRLRGMRAS
jgi:hypothetical protein